MSEQRDELARDIFIADNRLAQDPAQVWDEASESHRYYAGAIADGLIAAGYRKPRTITTVEELDALAMGSVILDGFGRSFQVVKDDEGFRRYRGGNGLIMFDPLAATVLCEPTA